MRKRFVKLLLFKVDTQYRLLYGFSSETEQSSYLWKAFPADKKGQKLIVKAILSPSEADNFSINLTGTEPIMLSSNTSGKGHFIRSCDKILSFMVYLRHAALAGKNCFALVRSHALTPLRQVMPLTWLLQVDIAHMAQA